MRHAKAEPLASSDYERQLAPPGVAAARAAGEWLAGASLTPDQALVSSAVRTAQTWAAVAEGAAWPLEPVLSRALYGAEPETVLDVVREVPASVSTLLLIGHNPTIATLAQLLDDGTGEPEAARAMAGGVPTSGCAVFEVTGDWADLDLPGARLRDFQVPR